MTTGNCLDSRFVACPICRCTDCVVYRPTMLSSSVPSVFAAAATLKSSVSKLSRDIASAAVTLIVYCCCLCRDANADFIIAGSDDIVSSLTLYKCRFNFSYGYSIQEHWFFHFHWSFGIEYFLSLSYDKTMRMR